MIEIDLRVTSAPLDDSPPAGLVAPVFREEVAAGRVPAGLEFLGDLPGRLLGETHFEGRLRQVVVAGPAGGVERLALTGLGRENAFDLDRYRRAAGLGAAALVAAGVTEVTFDLRPLPGVAATDLARAAVEGALLATYRFDRYKTEAPRRHDVGAIILRTADPSLVAALEEAAGVAAVVGAQVRRARDLGNLPPNRKTPTRLAEMATEMAARRGLECRILGPEDLEALPAPCFLGVARGSAEPPAMIVLEHGAKHRASTGTIALVGKGITFDSGGISIKPAASMELMKYDMGGAAAVLATLEGIARLGLPIHVVGVVPCCENLPGGRALKPSDLLESHAGKTVEIISTDAEGRLILADALSYAATEFAPDLIVDLATLTGSCVIALGREHIGLFGTAEAEREAMVAIGRWSGDRVWPLPVTEDHHRAIEGQTADLRNSAGRIGGASLAAAFLSNFVHDRPWLHLDIAPTGWTEEEGPLGPKGATGSGVRLLIEFLRRRCATRGLAGA